MQKYGNSMKYNEATTKVIYDSIEQGSSQADAAIMAGIDQTTLSRWKKKYAEFAKTLRQKEIACKTRNINIIQNAANDNWTAAAWWLERKYDDEFAKKEKREYEGNIEFEIAETKKMIVEIVENGDAKKLVQG